MITIIHGDDVASSRSFLLEQKKKAQSPLIFDGKKLGKTDLVEAIEGEGLFSSEKKLFIENLLFSKRAGHEFDEILAYISQNESNADIFMWEGVELSKKQLSTLKKATFQIFSLPKNLFMFLDSIRPHNATQIINFHKTLAATSADLIFYMIVRHFRILLSLKEPFQKNIDEVARLAPWQLSKYKRQLTLYSVEKLKDAYKRLFKIESAAKTGASPLTLTQSIDFFLLSL